MKKLVGLGLIWICLTAFPGTPAGAATLFLDDIVTINLDTNEVLLLNGETGATVCVWSGDLLSEPIGVVVAPDGRILVSDRVSGLIAIDPETGNQSLLANTSEVPVGFGLAFEPSGDLILAGEFAGDLASRGVHRIDMGTFAVSLVALASGVFTVGDLAVAADGTIWIADDCIGGPNCGILRMDPMTGVLTPPLPGWPIATALSVTRSPLDGGIYVNGFPDDTSPDIVRIDPTTLDTSSVDGGAAFGETLYIAGRTQGGFVLTGPASEFMTLLAADGTERLLLPDTGTTYTRARLSGVGVARPVVTVPSLDQLGLGIFVLSLLGFGLAFVRRAA